MFPNSLKIIFIHQFYLVSQTLIGHTSLFGMSSKLIIWFLFGNQKLLYKPFNNTLYVAQKDVYKTKKKEAR